MQPARLSDPVSRLDSNSPRAMVRKLTAKVLTYFSQREIEQLHLLRQRLLDYVHKNNGLTEDQMTHCNNVRYKLDKDGISFSAAFLSALEKAIGDEVANLRNAQPSKQTHVKSRIAEEEVADAVKGLSLMGADEMDRILGRDNVIHQFNNRYEEQLLPFTQHLRGLFDSNDTTPFSNPYRPEVLLRAFTRALEAKGVAEVAAEDALRAMHPKHWVDLAPLYADLDKMLESSGLASEKHRVRKAPAGQGGGTGSGWGRTGGGPYAGTTRHGMQSAMGVPPSLYGDLPAGPPLSALYGSGRYPTNFHASYPHPMTTGFGVGQPAAYGPGSWSVPSQAKLYLRQLGLRADTGGTTHRTPLSPTSRVGNWGAVSGLGAEASQPLEPYLISYLEELQAQAIQALSGGLPLAEQPGLNVLRELHENEQFLHERDPDRGTLDALAEIFDFVFADDSIPAALKVVIGRLQIPVLKAALLNREFFLSANHPARKLIDALAAAAIGWSEAKGLADPLYVQIEASVKRILNEFNEDLALFNEVLLEFEDFVRTADRVEAQQVAPAVKEAEAEEALDSARTQVDFALHPRLASMATDSPAQAFLVPFLTEQWREVLARAMSNQAQAPDEYAQLLNATDQLIWSTQHKADGQERRQLIGLLPVLVKLINTQLDKLDWVGPDRDAFTQQLIAAHMNALRSGPEEAARAVVPAGDREASEIAVRALDERVAEALEGEVQGAEKRLPDLKRGMWFELITQEGHLLRCRLTWISPKRTRFLFTNREGFDAFVRSEEEISGWLINGAMRILPQEPIVGRALEVILSDEKSDSNAAPD